MKEELPPCSSRVTRPGLRGQYRPHVPPPQPVAPHVQEAVRGEVQHPEGYKLVCGEERPLPRPAPPSAPPERPARLDASVLVGPYRASFIDIYEPLLAAGGAVEIRNAEDMARHVLAWIQNPASRDAAAASAAVTLERLSGGLERTTQAIIAMLGRPSAT